MSNKKYLVKEMDNYFNMEKNYEKIIKNKNYYWLLAPACLIILSLGFIIFTKDNEKYDFKVKEIKQYDDVININIFDDNPSETTSDIVGSMSTKGPDEIVEYYGDIANYFWFDERIMDFSYQYKYESESDYFDAYLFGFSDINKEKHIHVFFSKYLEYMPSCFGTPYDSIYGLKESVINGYKVKIISSPTFNYDYEILDDGHYMVLYQKDNFNFQIEMFLMTEEEMIEYLKHVLN